MSNEESRKRTRPNWKDLPAFLDASASVSACTFGARRLPEIKALDSGRRTTEKSSTPPNVSIEEYKSGGKKTSSRHLRRRTTSYRPRRRHRYPSSSSLSHLDSSDHKPKTRRARRKPARLQQEHEAWNDDATVKWMTTHIWHAKRFHMHPNLFGWRVPLLHNNRGAGAALRLAREGKTLLQDVSWCMQPLLVGSTSLDSLCRSMTRIIPNLLPSDRAGAILSSNAVGEDVIHELDAFPKGAIGEATWWISRNPIDGSSIPNGGEARRWWMHLFVHVATISTVEKVLADLAETTSDLFFHGRLEYGVSWFRLRGTNATECLVKGLLTGSFRLASGLDADAAAAQLACDFDRVKSSRNAHKDLPHLTCIPVMISLEHQAEMPSSEIETKQDDVQSYIDAFGVRLRDAEAEFGSAAWDYKVATSSAIFVSHCSRDPDLSMNVATCGWDVICSRDVARDVFLALTLSGKACSIGMVEAAHIQLECHPPLPVFPRDHPDTPDGGRYWDGGDKDWSLVRRWLEGGLGRVAIPKAPALSAPMVSINWNTLVRKEDESGESSARPVVVRGDFGQPIVDALTRSCHIPSCAGSNSQPNRRRPRRRVRNPTEPTSTVALNDADTLSHKNVCSLLLQALALPAIVRCHVSQTGTGPIVPGSAIIGLFRPENQSGEVLLGTVVVGSFSHCRGRFHGTGFVGASQLLCFLLSPHGTRSFVAVTEPDGENNVHLKVAVVHSTTGSHPRTTRVDATMTLIL